MSEPTTAAGQALAKVSSWPGGERVREAQIAAIEAEAAAAARTALLAELETAVKGLPDASFGPYGGSYVPGHISKAAVLDEINRRRP